MKIKALILLFFCVQTLVMGQEKDSIETIKWSPENLTWNDFKAKSIEKSTKASKATTGLTYTWSYSVVDWKPVLDYEVYANFYPKDSWVKPTAKNPNLLQHEQLHFDITELFARKLNKAFSGYVAMRDIRGDLARMYKKFEALREKTQKRYDRETDHGLNKTAQEEWEHYVKKELKKLVEFSSDD